MVNKKFKNEPIESKFYDVTKELGKSVFINENKDKEIFVNVMFGEDLSVSFFGTDLKLNDITKLATLRVKLYEKDNKTLRKFNLYDRSIEDEDKRTSQINSDKLLELFQKHNINEAEKRKISFEEYSAMLNKGN